MNFTDEQLAEIELMGSCFFTYKDIAVLLEVDPKELKEILEDQNSEVYKSYEKGRLKSELEVRKSVVDLAKRGSSQAQEMVLKYITDIKISKLD